MIPNHSPETPGAIRANIAYLRNRKVALDQLIQSLERYTSLGTRRTRKALPLGRGRKPTQPAGAA
jgi:hypothetical protein